MFLIPSTTQYHPQQHLLLTEFIQGVQKAFHFAFMRGKYAKSKEQTRTFSQNTLSILQQQQ